jgi:hypothetical protein
MSRNDGSVAAVGRPWEIKGASSRWRKRNQPHSASARNTHILRHGFVPRPRIVNEDIQLYRWMNSFSEEAIR